MRNVHEALPEAMHLLRAEGVRRESRNGPVLQVPMPVTTMYTHPQERVLFWSQRDANPFFHFYEGLWMLNGQHDVKSLTRFVKRMGQFSDDGVTFRGAYGRRWRHHFGFDQLAVIAARLRHDHDDRRQVLQMFDAGFDLNDQKGMRDIPCNLSACFQVNDGALDMTVYNRSNDIVWGCYGANAVHFSMLHEVMAAWVGVPMGRYWQVSFNWHAYLDTAEPLLALADQARGPYSEGRRTPYEMGLIEPFPMVTRGASVDVWMNELRMFMSEEDRALGYRDPFFRRVAIPMVRTHNAYRTGGDARFEMALAEAANIYATDWRTAATEWLQRRKDKARGQD